MSETKRTFLHRSLSLLVSIYKDFSFRPPYPPAQHLPLPSFIIQSPALKVGPESHGGSPDGTHSAIVIVQYLCVSVDPRNSLCVT